MSAMTYRVEIAAVGEVRDADGNLIHSEPVTASLTLTAEQLAELQASQEGELS